MKKQKAKSPAAPVVADEPWKPVQVASCLGLTYQDARNRMLHGEFGQSEYNDKTRSLTVSKLAVLAVKEKHDRKRRRR